MTAPSDRERLREAGIPTTTVSRLCMETHHDFCALYDCKCSCHERSTGQTEEETSDGRDERLAVAGDNDSHRDGRILSGGNRNDTNPQAPLTPHSVSALTESELEKQWIADGSTNSFKTWLIRKLQGASSSNAALRMNVTYERTLKEQWRVRCIAAESNQHETEAERDSLREALREFGKHAEGCSFMEWDCTQPTCAETHSTPCNCGLSAALGDPPEGA